MHSSLFYQMMTFFNQWFLSLFSILELGLMGFKYYHLPYPGSYLTCDIILITFTFVLEFFRIDLSRSGNLTEKQLPIIVSIPLGICSVLGSVYILLWQTYVLRIELILSAIQLVFQGVEIMHTFILAIGFHQKSTLT